MSELVLWEWEKKKRTMIRFIKPGDIFCFQYNENTYCFGRIIWRLHKSGTPAEIFDYFSDTPSISEKIINSVNRMFPPINLDIYTLFDKKLMGEWRIIGCYANYTPENVDDVFFTYGLAPYKKMDVYGNETIITKEEAKSLQDFTYLNDTHIKELVKANFEKQKSIHKLTID